MTIATRAPIANEGYGNHADSPRIVNAFQVVAALEASYNLQPQTRAFHDAFRCMVTVQAKWPMPRREPASISLNRVAFHR